MPHDAVRTRCHLKAWGHIDSDRSTACSRVETRQHCFLDCPRVLEVRNPTLSCLQGSPFLPSFQAVMFPLANFAHSRLSVYHYFLATNLFFCVAVAKSGHFLKSRAELSQHCSPHYQDSIFRRTRQAGKRGLGCK